jgi:hypothetical protein
LSRQQLTKFRCQWRLNRGTVRIITALNHYKDFRGGDGVDAALPRRQRNVPSLRC